MVQEDSFFFVLREAQVGWASWNKPATWSDGGQGRGGRGDRRPSLRRAHCPLSAGRSLSGLQCIDLNEITFSRLQLIFQSHAEFIGKENDTDSVKEGTELLEGEVALCTFQNMG